jgi:hypothetical protein
MTFDTDSTQRETLYLSGRVGRGGLGQKIATVTLAVVAIAIGGLFLAFGLALLLGLAVVGTITGAGVMVYHRLTGRWPRFLTHARETARQTSGLDPAKEVFAEPPRGPDTAAHNEQLLPP